MRSSCWSSCAARGLAWCRRVTRTRSWSPRPMSLARILAQDIERDEDGPRLKRGVAPDRLISVHDPEMRHGRKSSSHRFNGHKAQVAVDTETQLITAVDVLAGNAPDAEQALEVVEASEAATGGQVDGGAGRLRVRCG